MNLTRINDCINLIQKKKRMINDMKSKIKTIEELTEYDKVIAEKGFDGLYSIYYDDLKEFIIYADEELEKQRKLCEVYSPVIKIDNERVPVPWEDYEDDITTLKLTACCTYTRERAIEENEEVEVNIKKLELEISNLENEIKELANED